MELNKLTTPSYGYMLSIGVAGISYYVFCNNESVEASKDISKADREVWNSWRMNTIVRFLEEKGLFDLTRRLFGDDTDSAKKVVKNTGDHGKAKENMHKIKCRAAVFEGVLLIAYAYYMGKEAAFALKMAVNVADMLEYIFEPKAYNASLTAKNAKVESNFVQSVTTRNEEEQARKSERAA